MRYIPHTSDEIKEMLATIGASKLEDLFCGIPEKLRCKEELDLPHGLSEAELSRHTANLSKKNATTSSHASFLGAGAYRHYTPAAVSEIASRSEFVTPYTPYQPEVSQGTLQAIFEYQSQITRLFEMDVSNASHYSGATACADAVLMARRISRKCKKIAIPTNLHPEYADVVKTTLCGSEDIIRVEHTGGLIDRNSLKAALDGGDVAAVLVQFPNFFGIAENLSDVANMTAEANALLIACVPEPISLGLLKPPGSWGADIAVGEGLSFGMPTSFGGPGFGIFTVREKFLRQMPGRVCGKTVDSKGRTGYVLTLSTREQHIRREKATSNICTNQALCATQTAVYLAMLGKQGIRELASINASLANYAKNSLSKVDGVTLPFDSPTFNEFVIETKNPAKDLISELSKKGIFAGVDLSRWYPNMANRILVCATEMNTKDEIDEYVKELQKLIK